MSNGRGESRAFFWRGMLAKAGKALVGDNEKSKG
jgi:hypothetical protein